MPMQPTLSTWTVRMNAAKAKQRCANTRNSTASAVFVLGLLTALQPGQSEDLHDKKRTLPDNWLSLCDASGGLLQPGTRITLPPHALPPSVPQAHLSRPERCQPLSRIRGECVVQPLPVHRPVRNLTFPQTIHFLHIHKGGGTTLCRLAEQAGERVGLMNCNADPELAEPGAVQAYQEFLLSRRKGKKAGIFDPGDPKWQKYKLQPGFRATQALVRGDVQQQCQFFSSTNLTFVATEAPSPNQILSGVMRMTMLRNPLDRHVSEFQHCLRSPLCKALGIGPTDLIRWLKGKQETHNNFQLRVILGDASYGTNLTQYDLEEAKDRLRTEYALVLILEKFEPVGRMLIQQVFGWNVDTSSSGSHRHSNATNELPLDELLWIQEHNALDMQLYEYANELFLAHSHRIHLLDGMNQK